MEEPSEPKATKKEPVPAAPRPSFQRFLMIFLVMMALWMMFVPEVARDFGAAAGLVFDPLIGFGGHYPVITILLAGMLTTLISSVLRDRFTNWVEMARMNKIVSSLRKEQMDALRRGNMPKVQKLKEVQAEMQKDFTTVQFAPMKSMAYTLVMFVIVFTWLRSFVDVKLTAEQNQFFAVPWSANTFFHAVYVLPTWILLYSLLAIPFGQIAQRVLKYFRFKKALARPEAGTA